MARTTAGIAAAAFGLALALSAPAFASPVALAWSTYLRAAPDQAAPVVDELEHDTTVDLRGCAGAWCRVAYGRSAGFIDRDALTLPRPPGGPGAKPADCVVARQPGYRGPDAARFCSARLPSSGSRP